MTVLNFELHTLLLIGTKSHEYNIKSDVLYNVKNKPATGCCHVFRFGEFKKKIKPWEHGMTCGEVIHLFYRNCYY